MVENFAASTLRWGYHMSCSTPRRDPPPSEAVNMAALKSRLCNSQLGSRRGRWWLWLVVCGYLHWSFTWTFKTHQEIWHLSKLSFVSLRSSFRLLKVVEKWWVTMVESINNHQKQTEDDWSLIHALPCRWRPPMLPPMWLLQRQRWRHCLHYDHASREKQGERCEKWGERHEKKQWSLFLWSKVY